MEMELPEGKLIRNKIPGLAQAQGVDMLTVNIKGEELKDQILEKMKEEYNEAQRAYVEGNREEIAEEFGDLLEIMDYALGQMGISWEEVMEARRKKAIEKGDFKGGVYWIYPKKEQ